MKDGYLKGRSAMVTGGASGQGRAISLALAAAGADVAIGSLVVGAGETQLLAREETFHPSESELERVQSEIEAKGVRALACNLDVRSDESVQAFYDAANREFGKVDILANAAGTCAEQPIVGHPDALWHKIIDVNLNGYYRTIKLCLPGMIERGWGRIVNIASTAASIGAKGNPAYCASKHGVLGLTRCVALEGAAHGVTCNAISPGYVNTGMMRSSLGHMIEDEGLDKTVDELIAEIADGYPQKRIIEPEEIGALAAFLCSDGAAGINMDDITVSTGSLW